MGQRFRDAGYRTAYTGKWHLDGHDYHGSGACPDGWDERFWYDGMRYQADLSDADLTFWRQGQRTIEALRAHGVRPEFTWGHRVADRAIDFLEEAAGQPSGRSCWWPPSTSPHGPFTCPPEYAEPFRDFRYPWALRPATTCVTSRATSRRRRRLPSGRGQGPEESRLHPLYFGCNSFVDGEIGRLVDAVDRLAPDNTLIVFTSDHGDMLGAHGLQSKGAPRTRRSPTSRCSSAPLLAPRGSTGARDRTPGTRVPTLASHIDVLPTFLELAGLPVPPALEGTSLAPVLHGEPGDPDRAVFVEDHRFAAQGEANGGFTPCAPSSRATTSWRSTWWTGTSCTTSRPTPPSAAT